MKFKRLLLPSLFLICAALTSFAQISINEYSASNLNQFIDNYNTYEDWIELYNAAPDAQDISGWYLTDNPTKPTKWAFPPNTIIPANGFLRVWCSGRNDTVFYSNMHTSFKITQTKGTEVIVLSDANGNIVESTPVEITQLAHSRCKEMDGMGGFKICEYPTPRASNNFSTKRDAYTAQPTMSINAGFYAGEQTVVISSSEPNSTLRYTLDGTNPKEDSPEYTDPIVITETTIIKARSFSNDVNILPGKMQFNTYFINEDFTLPVISIAADELLELAGGDKELRPIGSIEWFNTDKQRSALSFGELNSHGQDSWVHPQRSLDWISRDEMGYNRTIEEKVFSYSDRSEYQRMMFRASGDDNYPSIGWSEHEGSCHIRDEFVHTLALEGDMNLEVRAVERGIVFLNGIYWGVYGLRERPVDHDYTKYYFGQEKYDLQYLATWGNTWAEYGDQSSFNDWAEIRDFVLNNDMGIEANYERVDDEIKLLSLIDYMITNLNAVSSDWLNYNTGWWRGLNPNGDRKKWGYILWDNDATFDYYINYSGVPNTDPDAEPCDINDISDYMDQFFNGPFGGPDVGKHEKIFLKLQEESETFRQLYYSRQADLMNTVFSCDNMLSTLDRMIDVIAPEMPRHIQRWGGSMTEWQDNLARLKGFIEQRCTLLDDGMVNCFEVDGPYDLTLMIEPAIDGLGEIDLNTLDIEAFPWTGQYFGGMDNILKARAFDDDYEFLYWESKAGNVVSPVFDRRSTIRLTQSDTLIAHFGIPTSTVELQPGVAFKAYPTIVKDQLTVEYELEEATHLNISLHSVLGNTLLHFSEISGTTAPGNYQQTLDIAEANLPAGLYFLNFTANDKIKSVKLQIMR